MAEGTMRDLEAAAGAAGQVCAQDYETAKAANEKAAAAQEAYQQALNDACNEYDGRDMEEKMEKLQEAREAQEAANAEAEAANGAFAVSAKAAQAAEDAVEAKKEELREARAADTSYVVHTARIECSCAYQNNGSYLTLGATHGVYARQIPQMTVKDTIVNANVVNFGYCTSPENPKVMEAAEQAVLEARAEIEANKGWRDHLADAFFGEKEIEVTESLLKECAGECIAQFPIGAAWQKEHPKVTINGESPLLRRCELTCIYGGHITILMSGQPE